MGVKHVASLSLRNYRICSRHFTADCYLNTVTMRLRKDAVPTLFPAHESADNVITSEIVGTAEQCRLDVEERRVEPVSPQPGPSISRLTPTKQSMFRGILNVSEAHSSPRKLKLMKMVKNKEAHIRNLKKMCRERAQDIKALIDLSDSCVVQNIFRGMSKPTTMFLMSDDEQVLLSNLIAFINTAPPDVECPDAIETISSQSEISNSVEIANYVANCVSTGMTQTLSVAYVSGFIYLKK